MVKTYPKVIAIAVLLFCSNLLFGWSAEVHKTIAKISWDFLQKDAATHPSGQAAKAIHQIHAILESLGSGTTLEDISVCADEIRILKPNFHPTGVCAQFPIMTHSAPWHYIDIPISDAPQKASNLIKYCPKKQCVTKQVSANFQLLHTATDVKSKQLALMFLVHLVADMHQPLHCASEISNGVSDRGGNEKSITFILNGEHHALNLHSLWDHLIQPTDNNNDPLVLSQRLEAEIPSNISAWVKGDFITQAVLESFQFSKNNIYPNFYGNGPDAGYFQGNHLDIGYQKVMSNMVDQRLELAGVRLAILLKQAFNKGLIL